MDINFLVFWHANARKDFTEKSLFVFEISGFFRKYRLFYIKTIFLMIQYAIDAMKNIIAQGFHMSPFFIIIIVGCIIQIIKVSIDIIRYKRIYTGHIFASGWFPSFHSGLASSVTMLVWLEYGLDSTFFAVAFAFSLLFAYDAMNHRYETWQHAHYINDLRSELQAILQKKEQGLLKERIWHTPIEVVWGIIFGSVLTYVFYYIYFIK